LKAVVVALGKIGLPLATQIARAGHEVIGCDIDAVTVGLVNAYRRPRRGGPAGRWPRSSATGACA
jgi:UDP-N-acetyl-D-mannosaminuronic acid dehydrogenase